MFYTENPDSDSTFGMNQNRRLVDVPAPESDAQTRRAPSRRGGGIGCIWTEMFNKCRCMSGVGRGAQTLACVLYIMSALEFWMCVFSVILYVFFFFP